MSKIEDSKPALPWFWEKLFDATAAYATQTCGYALPNNLHRQIAKQQETRPLNALVQAPSACQRDAGNMVMLLQDLTAKTPTRKLEDIAARHRTPPRNRTPSRTSASTHQPATAASAAPRSPAPAVAPATVEASQARATVPALPTFLPERPPLPPSPATHGIVASRSAASIRPPPPAERPPPDLTSAVRRRQQQESPSRQHPSQPNPVSKKMHLAPIDSLEVTLRNTKDICEQRSQVRDVLIAASPSVVKAKVPASKDQRPLSAASTAAQSGDSALSGESALEDVESLLC